jgi:hypothetical protein
MKRNKQSPLYFSAYPLKVIKETSSDNRSPFLKAILSGKTRTMSRIRVTPMKDPYISKVRISSVKPAKDVEPDGKDWFNNYE